MYVYVGVKGWVQNRVSPKGTCVGMHSVLCLGSQWEAESAGVRA